MASIQFFFWGGEDGGTNFSSDRATKLRQVGVHNSLLSFFMATSVCLHVAKSIRKLETTSARFCGGGKFCPTQGGDEKILPSIFYWGGGDRPHAPLSPGSTPLHELHPESVNLGQAAILHFVESHIFMSKLFVPDCQIWWRYLKVKPRPTSQDEDLQYSGFDLEL